MTIDFYGRGAAFPFSLDPEGRVQESSGEQKIEESIRIILATQFNERVMRPTFGCNLKSLAFAPNNEATAGLARSYVVDGLTNWEPRINVTSVTVTSDNVNGALLISINYVVRATLDARSLVYPFYLEKP